MKYSTIQMLVRTVVLSIIQSPHQVDCKVDRKGRDFWGVKPLYPFQQGVGIKSVSVYQRKNGNLTFLMNIGGYNRHAERNWGRSLTITLKPVNKELCLIVSKGKSKGFLERNLFEEATHELSKALQYKWKEKPELPF